MYKHCHTNIIMSIIFVFILNMIFMSYVQSNPPPIICGYTGADGTSSLTYEFKVSEVPSCCKDIFYGGYYFNQTASAQEATDIATIKKANKLVWVMYMCQDPKELSTVVCSKDPSALDNYLNTMVTFSKDNKIDGVILALLSLQDGSIPDYTNIVNALICRIKTCVPTIKIGVELDASASDKYTDKKIFDFSVTNANVDFYFVDLSAVSTTCKPNHNEKGGKLPINVLEKVWEDISCSTIDQTKLMAYALDYSVNSKGAMKPYTYYCARKGSDYWCADSIKNIYDQVKFLKKNFKGIVIIYMDADDYNNTCGCGLFPVANAMIDAWEGKPMKSCPTIC